MHKEFLNSFDASIYLRAAQGYCCCAKLQALFAPYSIHTLPKISITLALLSMQQVTK